MTTRRVTPCVFLAASIGYGAVALGMETDLPGADSIFGPKTFPLLLSVAGILLSVLLLRDLSAHALPHEGPRKKGSSTRLDWRRMAVLCAWMALYAAAIRGIGLWLATVLFLAGGSLLLGERRLRVVFAAALAIATFFQILLTRFLGIYVDDPLLRALGLG